MKEKVINDVADKILNISTSHPLRVGINGVDGSGKTHFAKSLVKALESKTSRQIIYSTIDVFHNPRIVRYQKGRESAEGFYQDSFHYSAVRDLLLQPLSPNGDRKYIDEAFNVRTDEKVEKESTLANNDAILIMEGIFLFRPELAQEIDYKIYIDVPFDIVLKRMLERDRDLYKSELEEAELYKKRYRGGQELYINEMHPKEMSDIVIDNSDFENPLII